VGGPQFQWKENQSMATAEVRAPLARDQGLIIHELPDETLIYDLTRHRAHRLNHTAALIWRQCDGQSTVADMTSRLQKELNSSLREEMVWMALDRLGKAQLLREQVTPPADSAHYSRREMMRKLGMAGGLTLLLPVVMSIGAPTAAHVDTACCGQLCGPDGGSACCSGCPDCDEKDHKHRCRRKRSKKRD
jgi:hypothetical protein